MADSHAPGAHAHHGPDFKLYLIIAGALAVFTAVSFIVNALVRGGSLTPMAGFAIILAVAVAKATLVGLYFMHIKYDWPLLYFMLIPAFVLACMMMLVLLPDIVFAWHHDIAIHTAATPPQ
jgi:cytochrome c oxidase subunit 4